uniref:DUF4236 domain-containing protein n=1 Tax=Bifidobacterium adolescentis TaxID=1680 RepID=UPI00359C8AB9
MGFRIRKSISLGKGMRVNLGKNGISSVTFGKRGAPHVTVGKRGTYVGASIPGTGISYNHKISGQKDPSSKPVKNKTKVSSPTTTAQLPVMSQPLETPTLSSPSDTDGMMQTDAPPPFPQPNRQVRMDRVIHHPAAATRIIRNNPKHGRSG